MERKLVKSISLLLIALFTCLALATFSACGESDGTGGNVTIIFADESGSIILKEEQKTEATTLAELMTEVAENKNLSSEATISFDTTGGTYGTTVNSFTINGTTYGDWNKGAYVMTYTSLEDAKYISVFEGSELTLDGIKYNACGLGVDTMPIFDGATYIFTIMVF